MCRTCTPTQNFRKIWNNRKHRFKPVFFLHRKAELTWVSADFAADGTKKEPLRIFSFIRILFICLEMVIQADTEAVFAGGLISVIVGIVHVKVERGGNEAKPETHFIFSFLGR